MSDRQISERLDRIEAQLAEVLTYVRHNMEKPPPRKPSSDAVLIPPQLTEAEFAQLAREAEEEYRQIEEEIATCTFERMTGFEPATLTLAR